MSAPGGDRTDEIRGRLAAATDGPWVVGQEIDGRRAGRSTVVFAGSSPRKRIVTVDQTRPHWEPAEPNVEFIAHAHEDVPWLLDENARLAAEVESLRARVEAAEAERDAALAQLAADAVDDTPCGEELWSWDYYHHDAVDPYWMRCHRVGPHDEHENSETGATWRTSAAQEGQKQ